jgi:hypothetical protein
MSTDVTTYAEKVRSALADLPAEQRDDLLEDLEGHLLEVSEDGDLLERIGPPEAYASELRASAGFPPPAPAARPLVAAVCRRVLEVPGGREAVAFAPELRPGWWVVRGYAAVVLLGSLTADDSQYGLSSFPVPTAWGSSVLGALLTVVAVVVSVRIGRGTDALPVTRRRAVVAANLALLVAGTAFAGQVRDLVGTESYYVQASNPYEGVLIGPGGPVKNIYPFDSLGRPLRDVQLFDQDGRPLSQLLRQSPDGQYAEPTLRFGLDGEPKPNVFPRDYRVDSYDEAGTPTTAPVPPPSVSPAVLAPRPTASPAASGSPSPSPTSPPSASPAPTPAGSPSPSPFG